MKNSYSPCIGTHTQTPQYFVVYVNIIIDTLLKQILYFYILKPTFEQRVTKKCRLYTLHSGQMHRNVQI